MFVFSQPLTAQNCKSNAELDTVPGKYQTAAQYPWPAVRAEYFKNLATATDKTIAKQILGQIESTEQRSHTDFKLTGGNWENYYSAEGYDYFGNARLARYTFQSSLHEYFCVAGKLKRNDEASTILRIQVNSLSLNTLERFLKNPFGSSMGDYDFSLQYMDWKSHKTADVNAQLITLFSYLSSNNHELINAINSGNNYFQDVAEKDIRPNNRNNFIYRYWFIKKKDIPVLIPVSRKEYLESLLEYYEREKLYFPKLIAEKNANHDKSVVQYTTWETDVADKIAVVKKVLSEGNEKWLTAQAIINRMEDQSQTYKAGLKERTNYNRFWKFYENENKSELLYKYNPEYFKSSVQNPAQPQIITAAFRYVATSSSLRILNNFTEHFNFEALRNMLK